MKSPYFHVGFADSGAHIDTVAMYNFPLRFLKYALRPEPGTQPPLSPEAAVHKLTGELADWYGIDAGRIRPGDRADLVVLNPDVIDDQVMETHVARFDAFDIDRKVNRNDGVVEFVFINGRRAYSTSGGYSQDLGQSTSFGQFLPARSASGCRASS